jgi:hypothetical protein
VASFFSYASVDLQLTPHYKQRGGTIEWIILPGILSYLVVFLGVTIWGWVEALHVPEGLLHFARTGMIGPARAALACGGSPNVRNDLGETPLLLAAANGHGEMVQLLLQHGANPALADMLGQTALSAAQAKGHTGIVEVLSSVTRRVKINAPPTPWRPNARWWLASCISLGAFLVIGLSYFYYWHPITAAQFLQLAEAKRIRYVRVEGDYLFGEYDPVWLPSKRFWVSLSTKHADADIKAREAILKSARSIDPYVDSSFVGEHRELWPGNWVIIAMLAWPMIFLGIPLWFLVGWNRFPFSTLSSARRSLVPSEPSPGTPATEAGRMARS